MNKGLFAIAVSLALSVPVFGQNDGFDMTKKLEELRKARSGEVVPDTVGGSDERTMEEILDDLRSQVGGDDPLPPEWSIEEGGTYVINGRAYIASFPSLTEIRLTLVREPPEPEPVVGRVINQFSMRPEVLKLGDELGIPRSQLMGWGLNSSLAVGLCGGDGWEGMTRPDGTVVTRDDAMLLARANNRLTRWEYGLYGSDGVADEHGGTWGRLVESGWENPAEYDGWLVPDIETWNMTLMSRRPDKPDQGYGYIWNRATDTVTLQRHYLARLQSNDLDARLAVHPWAIDTNGDGKKDALRFTRDDVIEQTIRIVNKIKAVFPKAKITWYNFPNMLYWQSDEDAEANMVSWEEAITRLHAAGTFDALAPSVYDHYSHLFRFPDTDDAAWERAQRLNRDRDRERFGRGVRRTLEMGDRLGIPTILYTWDVFHNDGRCTKSGWPIPWEEWEDHIRYLASLRSSNDTQVWGIYLWGARKYYWDKIDCYRTNMETYVITDPKGDPDAQFEVYDLARAVEIMQRSAKIGADLWGKPPSQLPPAGPPAPTPN